MDGSVASGITGWSYCDSGLTNGVTYYYQIHALAAGGNSPNSASVSATPHAVAPRTPTGITAVPHNGLIILTWNASPGATAYNVYRGLAPGAEAAIKSVLLSWTALARATSCSVYRNTTAGGEGSTTPIATLVSGTSCADIVVTTGTQYYYKVIGVNGGGGSGFSAEATAVPL